MFQQELLEHERRRVIYQYLRRNPGLHLRELHRRLEIPLSSLNYHLNYMVRYQILNKEEDGHVQRYFTVSLSQRDKELISLLRQKRIREIVLLVLTHTKIKFIDHHLLQRHHIGRETLYTLTSTDEIMKCLITYQSSFLDRLIDNALASWMTVSKDTS
jgi:predicted transcriptional regulator